MSHTEAAKSLFESYGGVLSKEETSFLSSVESQWPNCWGEYISALVLQRSLTNHAKALNAAATASERYGKSLSKATWALFFATLALVFVGIIQMTVIR